MVGDRQPVHDKCASLSNMPGPRNICKCSELCADLFTEDSPSGQRTGNGGTLIIVDIIDDMLSHDRAKAIKANLMPQLGLKMAKRSNGSTTSHLGLS